MTIAEDEYADGIGRTGRRVAIERWVDGAAEPLRIENVRARIRGFDPVEVSAGNLSGERRILVLAADVPEDFRPLLQNDEVVLDGARYTFTARPDDQTHREGEILLAYDGVATGA